MKDSCFCRRCVNLTLNKLMAAVSQDQHCAPVNDLLEHELISDMFYCESKEQRINSKRKRKCVAAILNIHAKSAHVALVGSTLHTRNSACIL